MLVDYVPVNSKFCINCDNFCNGWAEFFFRFEVSRIPLSIDVNDDDDDSDASIYHAAAIAR